MAAARREQLERLLKSDAKDPFLRYGLAMEHAAEGQHATAARLFAELLADSPDYIPAYFHSAQALLRDGRNGEARQVLEAGIARARLGGDVHAAEEMKGLLGTV
jgi:predicted Zn-dependent protease